MYLLSRVTRLLTSWPAKLTISCRCPVNYLTWKSVYSNIVFTSWNWRKHERTARVNGHVDKIFRPASRLDPGRGIKCVWNWSDVGYPAHCWSQQLRSKLTRTKWQTMTKKDKKRWMDCAESDLRRAEISTYTKWQLTVNGRLSEWVEFNVLLQWGSSVRRWIHVCGHDLTSPLPDLTWPDPIGLQFRTMQFRSTGKSRRGVKIFYL